MNYKKLTSHGSINIPIEMRRNLGLSGKDPMIVEQEGGKISIKPYILRCNFCGSEENVKAFHERGICEDCIKKIIEKTGEGTDE